MEYRDFQPTGFDPKGLGLEEQQDWLVAPVSRNRDSGPLDRANFDTLEQSAEAGEVQHEIHRFGHWANGWFELLLVHPDHAQWVEEWEGALSEYPCADDMRYSEYEYEEALGCWSRCLSLRDRVEACKRFRVSIFAARRSDELPEAPCGGLVGYLAAP